MGRKKRSDAELAAIKKMARRLEAERVKYRNSKGEKLSKHGLHRLLIEEGAPGVKNYSTLARILSGKRRPSDKLLEKAAKIFGVTPAHFIEPLDHHDRRSQRQKDEVRLARVSTQERRFVVDHFGEELGEALLAELAKQRQVYPKAFQRRERILALLNLNTWLYTSVTIPPSLKEERQQHRLVIAASRFLLAVERAMADVNKMCPALRFSRKTDSYDRLASSAIKLITSQIRDNHPERKT